MASFKEIVLLSMRQKMLLCILWRTQDGGNVSLALSYLHQQGRPQCEKTVFYTKADWKRVGMEDDNVLEGSVVEKSC